MCTLETTEHGTPDIEVDFQQLASGTLINYDRGTGGSLQVSMQFLQETKGQNTNDKTRMKSAHVNFLGLPIPAARHFMTPLVCAKLINRHLG